MTAWRRKLNTPACPQMHEAAGPQPVTPAGSPEGPIYTSSFLQMQHGHCLAYQAGGPGLFDAVGREG